jgi:hypothetical protein
MKSIKPRHLYLLALSALLCSCAATSIEKTWKSPDLKQPVGKIAVLTVDQRVMLRQGFENRLAGQLVKAGTPALVTYDKLGLEAIKADKAAAAEKLHAEGAQAVLILRLVGVGTSYRETQPGGPRYAATVTGIESYGWYDYYSVGFMSMSPTYGNLKQKLYLESILFDLKSEKRIWSGVSLTVVKENMDRVGEMDPLVEKIVAAMKKDGVIQ